MDCKSCRARYRSFSAAASFPGRQASAGAPVRRQVRTATVTGADERATCRNWYGFAMPCFSWRPPRRPGRSSRALVGPSGAD